MDHSTTARQVMKIMSTGQTIYLTAHEDRMLKRVYSYLAGYAQRVAHQKRIEQKREEVAQLSGVITSSKDPVDNNSSNITLKSYRQEQRTVGEIQTDKMFKVKDTLADYEEKYKIFEASIHKISFKDIDMVLKKLGSSMPKRHIEFMIWEVDEAGDGFVDWDEFQLTYYRNIMDKSGCEPSMFFHVLEFLTFDENSKGYIIEDDCMDILFARYGSSKLEQELRFLFGSKLRAEGGDGILHLNDFLNAILLRCGRRAVVP